MPDGGSEQNAGAKRYAVVFELFGAAAGISAFVAFVGGALMWLRLDELGLPADRVVAEAPRGLLIVLGANTLIVPAIIGVVATIVIYALPEFTKEIIWWGAGVVAAVATFLVWDAIADVPVDLKLLVPGVVSIVVGLAARALAKRYCDKLFDRKEHPLRHIALTAIVLGLAGIGLLASVFDLPLVPDMLIVAAAGLVGGTAIVAAQYKAADRRPVYWVVFVTFLLVGAGLALARTTNTPKLEPVAVLLQGPQQEIAGFYVGEWGGRIHIAQLKRPSGTVGTSGEPVEAIVSVDSSRVTRMAMRPLAGLGDDEGGRAEAEGLLEELVLERAAPTERIVEPIETNDPVKTFAPLLSLHSGERAWPTAVGYFITSSKLKWRFAGRCRRGPREFPLDLTDTTQWKQINASEQRGSCGSGPHVYRGGDYTRPHGKGRRFRDGRPELVGGEGFYLDLAKSRRYPPKPPIKSEGTQQILDAKNAPVYWEMHQARDAPQTDRRITYWFFYPYSIPPGGNDKIAHEGDWERISVLARNVEPGRWRPLSVRYHEHDTHIDVPWTQAPLATGPEGERTHPRGYVARNSHATYRRFGNHRQVLASGRVEIVQVNDEARACPRCPLWFTWQNLLKAQEQAWYGFGGAWGGVGDIPGSTGPLGPSIQKTLGGREPSPVATLTPSAAPPPPQNLVIPPPTGGGRATEAETPAAPDRSAAP